MILYPQQLGAATDYASEGGAYDSASLTVLPNNCALLMYGHWISSDQSGFPETAVWETVARVVSFDGAGWTLHEPAAFDWASDRWETDFATTVTQAGHVLIMTSRSPLRGYRLLEIDYTAMTVTAHAPVPVEAGPTTGTTSPSAYSGITTWGWQGARLAGTDDFIFVRALEVPVGFVTRTYPYAEAVRVIGTTVTVLDAVKLPGPAGSVNPHYNGGALLPVGSAALATQFYPYASTSETNPHVYRFWSLGVVGGLLQEQHYDLPVPAASSGSHLDSFKPLSLLYASPSSTYQAELVVRDDSNTQWGWQRWGLTVGTAGSLSVSSTPLPLDQLDLTARPDDASADSELVLGAGTFEPVPRFTVADTTLLVTIPAAIVTAGTPDTVNRLMIAQFDLTTGARGEVTWDAGASGSSGGGGGEVVFSLVYGATTGGGGSGPTTNGYIHVADAYLPGLDQYVVAVVDTDTIAGLPDFVIDHGAVAEVGALAGYPAGNIRLLDYTSSFPISQQLRSTAAAFL